MRDPNWMDRARCAGMDPAVFFPGRNENSDAKAICALCPVRVECLEYALTHRIDHGIWGGVGDKGRRKLRRLRRQEAIGG